MSVHKNGTGCLRARLGRGGTVISFQAAQKERSNGISGLGTSYQNAYTCNGSNKDKSIILKVCVLAPFLFLIEHGEVGYSRS